MLTSGHMPEAKQHSMAKVRSHMQLFYTPAPYCSYVSKYVTLQPGDLIFTGTPGETKAIKPGDVVEVEVEGVGVLRNKVVRVHN